MLFSTIGGRSSRSADLGQDRHAELPAAVGDHEIDDFGRHLLGRADEIALVLAVLGVHDDDDLARGDGLDGRFNGRKSVRHGVLLCPEPIIVEERWLVSVTPLVEERHASDSPRPNSAAGRRESSAGAAGSRG